MPDAPRVLWIGTPPACKHPDWHIQVVSIADMAGAVESFSPDVTVIAGNPDGQLEELSRVNKSPILVASTTSLRDAARYIRLGAHDVVGPEDNLSSAVETLIALRRAECERTNSQESWRKGLIGSSPAMDRIATVIHLLGPRQTTVLITGETGTGKEMVARALHMASPRARLPISGGEL